jgi:hypothetical protein
MPLKIIDSLWLSATMRMQTLSTHFEAGYFKLFSHRK